jgi:2-oxoisovalerate dehydrogenase E1 component
VDETRRSGGVGEGIITALVERRFAGRIARVSGADSYIPLGDAASTVLLTEDDIAHGVRELLS